MAATYFARGGKVGKTPLGEMAFGKTCGLRLGLSGAYPTPSVPSGHLPLTGGVGPRPLFYGSVEEMPRHLRPARCPHEQCLKVIAAALLS